MNRGAYRGLFLPTLARIAFALVNIASPIIGTMKQNNNVKFSAREKRIHSRGTAIDTHRDVFFFYRMTSLRYDLITESKFLKYSQNGNVQN